MLSYDELDRYFIENKINVSVYGGRTYNFDCNWSVKLDKTDDGIKVEVNANGVSLYQTMYDAYEKFNRMVTKGASNLLAPVIEHKLLEEEGLPVNDDIPF